MAGCSAGAAHGQSLSVYGVADVCGQYGKGTRNEVSVLSGSHDFGALKLLAGAQVVNNASGAPDTADNRREFWAGVNIPVGADTVALTRAADTTRAHPGAG